MSQPRVTIDPGALRHNLNVARKEASGARVLAVVKANGYGHGLAAVVAALEHADAIAVARLSEALAVRAAGCESPVVLLEGVSDRDELARAAAEGFELVVHSPHQIEHLAALPGPARIPVWFKVDTGMNRLGFAPEQLNMAARRLAACAAVRKPWRWMTHLACADEPDSDMTQRQIALFEELLRGRDGDRSIANSAGLIDWPEARADWVRPGIMLYGVSPFSGRNGVDLGLRPVMTLSSSVIAMRDLRPGERVGYGAAWTASRETRIAIAAVGYGDGYPRAAPNGTPVLLGQRKLGLAGRVSMDMLAIETMAGVEPRIGDPVTLWGQGLPVEEVAGHAGQIPYELLCGITRRVAIELRELAAPATETNRSQHLRGQIRR